MAKKTWVVATEEGAAYTHSEVGEQVDLDLSHQQEKALVAAGWVEEPKQQKKKEA